MFDTYKMMSKNTEKSWDNIDLSDLVFKFKSEQNPYVKSRVYASVFCRLFPLMFKLARTYTNLTLEDKAEICSQTLLDSLIKYAEGKKIKFLTYFHTSLKNKLITATTNQQLLKRKVQLYTVANSEKVLYILDSIDGSSNADLERKFILEVIDSDKLSTLEKEYCVCALAGYKNSEIGRKLDLAFRVNNIGMDNPIHDKENKRLASKVRRKLRVKLKDRNFAKIL